MLKATMTSLSKSFLIYGIGLMQQRFMGLLVLPFFTCLLNLKGYGCY